MIIGNKEFSKGTHIMGILNITPDSFFEDSRKTNIDDILKTVESFIKNGADIIDIGGQSTRPGSKEITSEEELDRIFKPIVEIKKNFDVLISVDTFYPYVAENILKEKVEMINDINGLDNEGMAEVIAKNDAAVCIMHNSRLPKLLNKNSLPEIIEALRECINKGLEAGISKDKICVDGGIGFGKTKEESQNLVDNYEKLHELNYPLLLGTSMKSFFGGNVEDRLGPTLETTRMAVEKDIRFVRVHHVKENYEIIKNY